MRDPDAPGTHGTVVEDRFTENVDVMPTILDWLDLPIPVQCDGRSLLPLVRGEVPEHWRDAAFWEWDFRDPIGGFAESILGLTMDQCSLSCLRDEHGKYVHFTGLPPLFYDLDRDPDEMVNRADDPAYAATVLGYAQRMLSLRMEHVEQTLTGLVVTAAGVLDGRRPPPRPGDQPDITLKSEACDASHKVFPGRAYAPPGGARQPARGAKLLPGSVRKLGPGRTPPVD